MLSCKLSGLIQTNLSEQMKMNHSLNCFFFFFFLFSEPGKGKKDPRKNIGRGKTKIVGYGEHFPGVFGEN